MTVVHQVLGAAAVRDAVSNEAREFRSLFDSWGWGGRDYAGRLAPGLGRVEPLVRFEARPADVLLFHHSGSMPGLGPLLALPNPKLLVYHNITPAEYLWDEAPLVAAHCAVGREQLPGLVAAADLAVGHSRYNARELETLGAPATEVLPVMVDLDRLGPAGRARGGGPDPTILFVGRLSPHKRQDELVRVFARYRMRHAPSARLTLVGARVSNRYLDALRALAGELCAGAVTIESELTERELGDRYRSAAAFVCLSEHEGFGIPLLEAFYADLPVIARPNAAIPEVAGDAAILVEDRDLDVLAELIHLVVTDPALRAELIRRGRRRVEAYRGAEPGRRLRELVETVTGAGSRRTVSA